MKYFRKYLLWVAGFFLISTVNFCTHQMSLNKSDFGYNLLTEHEAKNPYYSSVEIQFAKSVPSAEPEAITWEDLKDVTYKPKFYKQYNMDFQTPVFGKTVKEKNGKQLAIKGYMIPLDVNQGLYAVSRYPYASCYFCGKSGPESVVSLKFKTAPKKYKLDAMKTMTGTMLLNNTNPMDFIYIFKEAAEYIPPR